MDAILPFSGTHDVLASGLIRPPSGVCVLMSTYASETADNLRTSLESEACEIFVMSRKNGLTHWKQWCRLSDSNR